MIGNFTFFRVASVPDKPFDKNAIFDVIGTQRFLLLYDLSKRAAYIGMEDGSAAEKAQTVMEAVPGLMLTMDAIVLNDEKCTALSAYKRRGEAEKEAFADIFDVGLGRGALGIMFVPLKMDEMKEGKSYIERTLSKRESSQTSSFLSGVINKKANTSMHKENFIDSEELMFLTEVLESVNASILRNGVAYNVYMLLDDESGKLRDYINARFLVLAEHGAGWRKARALPVGISIAGSLFNFHGVHGISYILNTVEGETCGDIAVGTEMRGGVFDTRKQIKIEASSLNLGAIITGLPGSGKTNEAMAIIDGLSKSKTKCCVIAPTDEWSAFAQAHGFYLIKVYDNKTPINFFRCPGNANLGKFYEDLAMILSSASNAGPYTNPMEKCMLNAFRKVYSSTRNPDPVQLYDEIENSIRKFHAKKSNTGYKYTKHGENIKSALENLRAILNRPEYCSSDGIIMEDMVDKGVVFDLSNVSGNTKPYFYALILNQLYSMASLFDTKGDNELRLLLCIEEAQTIFKEKDSPAVQDLKYRIQDFRKQGIGLMLLAHNVTDIEPSIRRLCQTKIYLKQAPDVAPVASKELVFTYALEEEVIQKLKHLDSRIGAFSYVMKSGSDKISQDTIFIRTNDYYNAVRGQPHAIDDYLSSRGIKPPETIDAKICIDAVVSDSENQKDAILNARGIRLSFLGDEVAETEILLGDKLPTVKSLLQGKEYTIQLFDKKGRVLFSTKAIADREIKIAIE